jgi:hypothetical protein
MLLDIGMLANILKIRRNKQYDTKYKKMRQKLLVQNAMALPVLINHWKK